MKLSQCLILSGFLCCSGAFASDDLFSATTGDVILLAECGGFMHHYGELTGHQKLLDTGGSLASRVVVQESDQKNVMVSIERGRDIASQWYSSNAQEKVASYMRGCSEAFSRNVHYLRQAS